MGKNKYIETPDKLWEYFKEYKEQTKNKPFLIKDWVGKDADQVHREKERPLTIEGFECWLFDNDIIGDLSHYFANTNNKYENYLTICSRVKKAVRQDQIEGGMAGVYNPSITQRLNGLVEKVQTDNKHEVKKFEVEIIDNNPDAESK
jgi:hypothetical protein